MILASAVPISLDVFARKFFAVAAFESYEITTYILAVAVAMGYAHALFAGAHIRVDVLQARLPFAVQAVLDVVSFAALCLCATALAYYGTVTALESWRIGARANTVLGTPLAIPQFLWAAGLIWFAAVTVAVTALSVYLLARGQVHAMRALGREPGDRA